MSSPLDPVRAARRFPAQAMRQLDRAVSLGQENRAMLNDFARQMQRVATSVAELQRIADSVAEVRDAVRQTERRLEKRSGQHKQIMADLARVRRDVDALQRRALLDMEDTPYPERLTLQRFGLLSQNEEDGVVQALLRAAGSGPRCCVELGCGTNGGNTGFLVGELGFRGLMVDGGEAEVATVRHRFPPSRLTAVRAWIDRESVNELVAAYGFAGEVDVLSIDIDGNDLWVWEELTAVQPRIAIIEYNSLFGPERTVSVPYDRDFLRTPRGPDDGMYYGASLAGLAALGRRKGMRLVAVDHRGVNAFFVRDDLAPEIPACDPQTAWRLIDKYQRRVAEGLDVYARFEELGLALEDVG